MYVSYFPQLVAGPIERASNLLPQFTKKRSFGYSMALDGASQILWGLFKKIVVADNCAPYVNEVFGNYSDQPTSTLITGTAVFAFQIYADFSGYTDIAIGVAKLFGFNFKRNFNYPYFATNISDFWKKWHISLSSWLNDYVFTPLAINFRALKSEGPLIGSIGRLSYEKGFDVLLEAFSIVLNHNPKAKLVIIGEGHLRKELELYAKKLGVFGSTLFTGYTKQAGKYVSEFDVYVNSSRTEGTPITLLECLRAGKAIIATNVGGNSNIAELTITIHRPSWERTMEAKSWALGTDYSLILIQAPARDKGAVFLKREKEIYNCK